MTKPQAEELLQRLSLLPFNIEYHKEERGALMVVVLDCTAAQEKIVRETLRELGASTGRRFSVGQKVVIRRDDPGPYAGLAAVIEDVQPNDRGVAVLDRYVVVFSWGEKHTFYEPQLQNADEPKSKTEV